MTTSEEPATEGFSSPRDPLAANVVGREGTLEPSPTTDGSGSGSGTRSSEDSSETEDTKPRLLQWPSQRLESGLSRPLEIILNVLSLLLTALVFTYTGFLLRHNGENIEKLPTTWHSAYEFSRLGPTVVPLIFAFVVGRTVRSYGHWRLQEGERLSLLNSLFGSTTMTGTVTTIIDSKRLGLAGVILILVWSLSPLGGQATLRVLLQQTEVVTDSVVLPYLNFNVGLPQRYSELFKGVNIPVNTLFLGSIAAPNHIKNSSLDSWGNVKVPMIESLSQYNRTKGQDWISLDQAQQPLVYSSLLGIPLAGISQNHNTSFDLETSYLRTECTVWSGSGTFTPYRRNGTCTPGSCASLRFNWGALGLIYYPEGSSYKKGTMRLSNGTLTSYPIGRCQDPEAPVTKLLYYNFDATKDLTSANCSLSTSYVQVRVECSGWDCKPTAIRQPTLTSNPSSNLTYFDDCNTRWPSPNFDFFLRLLRTVTDNIGAEMDQPSILQTYLVQPELGISGPALWGIQPVHRAGGRLFSIRLGQILNTYWMAAVGVDPLFLGHPADYSDTRHLEYAVSDGEAHPSNVYNFSETQATVHTQVRILRYDKVWMIVLVVAILVLLFAAVVGLVLDLQIWVPRLLMNVSTLTRCNPNIWVPSGGGALSDEARGNLLADVKVRFGNVRTEDDVDDLVIGDCAETGGHVTKLTKRKLYT